MLGQDVRRGAVVDDRDAPLVRRQPNQQGPRQRLLASQRPESCLRPSRDDGGVGPEERWRAADDLPVGQRDVDRDVVSATRHDHGARASGSPKTANQYNSGSRRVQPSRPPSRSSAPRIVSRPMIVPTSPSVRSLNAAPRIAVAAHRWSGLMSRSARPWVPGVYAQTNRSFVSNGKRAAARWVASSPSSQARPRP